MVEHAESLMHGANADGQGSSHLTLLMQTIETNGLSQPLIKRVEGHEG